MTDDNVVDLQKKRQPPTFSDAALALRYVARSGSILRYVHSARRWYRFDGTRWAYDCTQLAESLGRTICATAATSST